MSGRPVGASTLLLVLRHSCWCFDTPADAMALLLHGQSRFDWCFGTPAGATTLLLRGQARPERCSGTHTGATTLLLRGQARLERCSGTSVAWAGMSCTVLRHLSTVLYLWVLIVLRPTHFL